MQDLDKLLDQSAAFEERLYPFFELPLYEETNRLLAVSTLASLSFEHSQSLKHLCAVGLCTSAAALLRLQYEALVRAIWVLYCASDKDTDLMVAELTQENAQAASNKTKNVGQMLAEIEQKAPQVPVDQLNEFKHYSWRPLNSFVHGGLHAVNRHGQGFPLELVCNQIKNSNGLLGLTGSLLLVIAGVTPQLAHEHDELNWAKICTVYADCLPLLTPALRTN